jgi:Bax protein
MYSGNPMPPCRQDKTGFLIRGLAGLLTMLALVAEAAAWSRYPVAYHPGYRHLPPAYVVPSGPYGRVPPAPAVPANRLRGGLTRHQGPSPEAPLPADAGQPQEAALPAALNDGSLTSNERKALFIKTLLPIIQAENSRLEAQRGRLKGLRTQGRRSQPLSHAQETWLDEMAAAYRVDADLQQETVINALLERVDVVPADLAIAQAANESAWGTSRFAQQANNLFGTWTIDAGKGIKPLQRAAGKTHLVRVYDTVAESVRAYMRNLNSHPAYQPFREKRARQRQTGRSLTAMTLAEGLTAYSELGDEYVARIQSLITDNKLEHATLL